MGGIEKIIDEHEILGVRRLWAFSRDQGDWETMRTLFHPDATISISWYDGDVKGFIEGSKKVFGLNDHATRVKHWFGNHRIKMGNTRAFLELDFEGRVREYIEGHLFDITFEGRFFDQFEKRDGEWKIAHWTAIYDCDRISPVVAGSVPSTFFDELSLSDSDAATAAWRFMLGKTNRPIHPMITGNSSEEVALRQEINNWLRQS